MMRTMHGVIAFVRPYAYWNEQSQRYYREGLRLHLGLENRQFIEYYMSRFPRLMKILGIVKYSYYMNRLIRNANLFHRTMDNLARLMEGPIKTPASVLPSALGQYLFKTKGGGKYKVCIDASDSGAISSYELLKWSDIYFKTNFSRNKLYQKKVFPMFNGNPIVLGNLQLLRSHRLVEKRYDLCFIVRVWGGTDEVSGVEHNIRLLEEVAKSDCSKYLLAYLVAGDIQRITRRLDKQGIPWSTTPMPLKKLWIISAQSQLNLIRLGMHYCIPWRMVDMLAMGACPVLDQNPHTEWPQPLQENINFFSLGIDCHLQNPAGTEKQYCAIPSKIDSWLSTREDLERISINNSEYFDRSLAPEKIGKFLMEKVEYLITYHFK